MADLFNGIASLFTAGTNAASQAATNRNNYAMNSETNASNRAMNESTNRVNAEMNAANNRTNIALNNATNASNRQMSDRANATNIALNEATNASNRAMNDATNRANAQSIAETNAQNYKIFQETNQREDNAVQRRVADLVAAGLSPTLAAGSAAQTGSPITLQAPQAQAGRDDQVRVSASRDNAAHASPAHFQTSKNAAFYADPVQVANIAQMTAQTDLMQAQAAKTREETKTEGESRPGRISSQELENSARELEIALKSDPETGEKAKSVLDMSVKNLQKTYQSALNNQQKTQADLLTNQLTRDNITTQIMERFGMTQAEREDAINAFALLRAGQNWRVQDISGRSTELATTESENFVYWLLRSWSKARDGAIYDGPKDIFSQIAPFHAGASGFGFGGSYGSGGRTYDPFKVPVDEEKEALTSPLGTPISPKRPISDNERKILEKRR